MLMRCIKSVWFWLSFFFVTFYYFSLLALIKSVYALKGKKVSTNKAHELATRWGKTFFNSIPGWQIELFDTENLPKDGKAYIIVANHESAADILAIYFLGIQFRWLAKDSIFKVPMLGHSMRWAGYVPIKRGLKESRTEALKESERLINSGTSMLYFPEGTRSTSGSPKAFKSGAFRIAMKCNVQVLPIVLNGAGNLMRKKALCPNSATIKVKILPPVEHLESESSQAFTQRVRDMIVAAHKSIS